MVKSKEQSDELFFVQVKDPSGVRKHVLESLKDIVGLLQRVEKFKLARHQKLEKAHKLRGLIKEANKMLGTLRLKMPQTKLKAAKEPATKPKNIPKHPKAKNTKAAEEKPRQKATEIDKLEAELNAIESKLKSLT